MCAFLSIKVREILLIQTVNSVWVFLSIICELPGCTNKHLKGETSNHELAKSLSSMFTAKSQSYSCNESSSECHGVVSRHEHSILEGSK